MATQETGKTGLVEFSGYIQEEFLRELRGKDGYKKYNEMRLNSPVIGALLLAIEQSIRFVRWEYTSEDGEDDPRLELLNDSWKQMSHSMGDHIIEILTMLPFGFSLFEIVYQRVNGKMLWRKFAPRGQDTVMRWKLDPTGGIEGFTQQTTSPAFIGFIPIEKLVLYRTRVEKNNPEGRSILRTSWIPYYYTKHIQQIEAIGIERDLAGLPQIMLPSGANVEESDSDSDYSKAKKLVSRVRNDEAAGIVVPDGWEFSLVSTGGQRAIDTDKIINRYEARQLMSALSQFLMLGQEGVGSLALSKDQTDFFTMSVNSMADIISDTHTKFAIPRLMALNGLDADGLRFEHSLAGDVDTVLIADFLQKVGAKVSWTTEDEIWLRAVARLPEKDPKELEAIRAVEAERRLAFLDRFGESDEEEQDDEQEEFAADIAPDDDLRVEMEGSWFRKMRKFWKGQQKRIIEGTSEIPR